MSGWQSRHKETFQADWIMPPIVGGIVALAASTVEVDVDLTTMPGSPANGSIPQGNDGWNPDPEGHYVTLQAEGGDVYFAFGSAIGGATGLGSLTATQQATVAANKIVVNNNDTIRLPAGATTEVKLPGGAAGRANADVGSKSPARYLGFLTKSGTATLRMWQSSP